MKHSLILILFLFTSKTVAGPHYLSGKLSNIATGENSLSIMLDSGVPDNCEGVPYNWMRISGEHTTMTSMVLAMWISGKLEMTVYTKLENGKCYITSVDPKFN